MNRRESPELFNRAAELFLDALDQPPDRRLSYLEAACGSNRELFERVCSFLAKHERGSILEEPGEAGLVEAAALPSFAPNVRYRIIEKVAEGGTAVVYRAEDTALDRVVALKLLVPHLLGNPDGLRRFEREAKAAAALDHPNICPVYDVGAENGRPFIAMAYVEGKTLAERLQGGPLAIDEAIDIASQVCRGLAAAHSKQIVHRDIKPANLIITETTGAERLVRILDFGIARLSAKSDMTAEGLTVGTVSYMAPEQIEQSSVDGRADLWALGVVLYRMITGALPFQGETTRDIIAAIAGADPKPLSSIRDRLPPALGALLEKALQKDPDRRFQTADEFLASLLAVQSRKREGSLVRLSIPKLRSRRQFVWAGVPLVAVLAAITVLRWPTPERRSTVVPVPFTSFIGSEGDPAISPDGTRVAFTWTGKSPAGVRNLYVKLIGSDSLLRLTNTPKDDYLPTWSPDGKRIAFIRTADYRFSLFVVSALGGPEQEIARGKPGLDYYDVNWSPAGDVLATAENDHVITITLQDRHERVLTSPEKGDKDGGPKFDPSGRRIVFLRYRASAPNELLLIPATGGTPRVLDRTGTIQSYCWNSDGKSIVLAGHAAADGSELRLLRIADGSISPLNVRETNAASPDIRGNLLAYTRRIFNVNIWGESTAAAAAGPSSRAAAVIASSRRDHSPQFSPDGKSVVFASTRSGSVQIWRADRSGDNAVELTFGADSTVGTPRWSPDGRRIAFDAGLKGEQPDIYVVGADGGPTRRITKDPAMDILPSWSSDGRWIYFCSNRDGQQDIWKISPDGGHPVLVTRNGWESFASADGRYLYFSDPTEQKTIHRLDLTTGAQLALPQLGDAGARRYWGLAEHAIYFVNTLENPHWVQRFDLATGHISKVRQIGKIIIYGPGGLAVSRDGRNLLWVQVDQDDQDIMLARNFR